MGKATSLVLACVLAHILAGRAAHAQAERRGRVEVEAGFSYGLGGDYRSREGFSLGALLGASAGASRRSVFALALHADGRLGGSGDDCELRPDGSCRPDFPILYSLAALIGRSWRNQSRNSLTVLAGPSLHAADEGGRFAGVSARVQGGIALTGPLSLTLTATGAALPNLRGDLVTLSALNVGIALSP